MAQQNYRVGLYQSTANICGQPAGRCEIRISWPDRSGPEHCMLVAHARMEISPSPSQPLSSRDNLHSAFKILGVQFRWPCSYRQLHTLMYDSFSSIQEGSSGTPEVH